VIKRHAFLVVLGLLHAIAACALIVLASVHVLDRFGSDTPYGTAIQITPFIGIGVLFFAFPAYLAGKKRVVDASIVVAAAVVGMAAIVFFTHHVHAPGTVTADPCTSKTRDALPEEEKLACPNWCPYKGPLLGGNYWVEDGERCVYL
jgi:hypothetical protein